MPENRALAVRTSLRGDANVLRLKALGALLHVELDLLSLLEGAEARRLDGGLVAENVCTPVILRDESEALRVVEPLHGALGHLTALLFPERGALCLPPPAPGGARLRTLG